jgi:hypothetical protein
MIGKLLLIEWIKTRRRPVFWFAILGSLFVITMQPLSTYLIHRSVPVASGIPMPESWPGMLSTASGMLGTLLACTLALLVAAEGGWKTQRQNIIDGLSRTEYVVGKLLFGFVFLTLIWILMILVTTLFGHLDTRVAEGSWTTFADPLHYRMMGGALLHVVTMAALGIFVGLLLGNGGAALACIVLLPIVQAILISIFVSRGGFWTELIPYLPISVSQSLRNQGAYDAVQFAEFIERSGTGLLSAGGAALMALGYIALFVWGGWAVTRHRDL